MTRNRIIHLFFPYRYGCARGITPRRPLATNGFTLIELITVIATIAILAGIIIPMLSGIRTSSKEIDDAQRLRSLGAALLLYAQENHASFPRSFHSAGGKGEPGWALSIAPFMDSGFDRATSDWASFFQQYYRSPFHGESNPYVYSYGLNVFFELDPSGDSYQGAPQTWNRVHQIPNPAKTILLAPTEPVLFGDHFMCHLWGSNRAAQNATRMNDHDQRANFLFVDGHVERKSIQDTFDTEKPLNLWHPQPDLL